VGIRLLKISAGALVIAIALSASAASGLSTSNRANDRKIARAGALTAGDLPSAWTQRRRDVSDEAHTDAIAAKIPICRQFIAFSKANRKNPRVRSPEFALQDSTFDNTVNVFPSERAADKAMQTFGGVDLPECMNKLFKALLIEQLSKNKNTAAHVKSVDVDIQPYNVQNYGDDTVSYEGSVRVSTKDGSEVDLGVGNTAVRVGRVVSAYSYLIAQAGASDALEGAVQSSLARLQQALEESS
jgi:hypothetical protein